ncbi:sensor histidine kinase [Microbulbifer sp. JMSA004]|uniref:sensor histidine kinase n=1 Tax=Microbulbifer sp. JMSA004 TaxID=3243370 RepID=UPI004039FD89
MTRKVLCPPTNKLNLFLTIFLVVLVMGLSSSQVKRQYSAEHTAKFFSPIKLTKPDTRYRLGSLNHSSDFIVASEGLLLENAPDLVPQGQAFGQTPDFEQHDRFWLYANIVNYSENSDWVLHIRNFDFQQFRVLIRGRDGQVVHTLRDTDFLDSTDISTIGRAVNIELQKGESYLLVIELNAKFTTGYPYLVLMGEHQYKLWNLQMDYTFKIMIGIILGFILLGFLCWLLMAEMTFFWGSLSSLLMLIYYIEFSCMPAILWQSTYEKATLFWLLVSSSLLSLLAFSASFLQIKRSSGIWNCAFVVAVLTTVSVAVASTMISFKESTVLYIFNSIFVWLLILSSGISKARKDGHYYTIYICGWPLLIMFILEITLVVDRPSNSIEEVNEHYEMIQVLYVQILHMLIQAIALILRIKALYMEKLKMEKLNHEKSRFIAQSSHDLSQPLYSMGIFLEHLNPHVHGVDGKMMFEQLKNTHHQLSESFHSIIDLCKLEYGGIIPELKSIQLTNLFSQLQNEMRILAEAKSIRLKFQPCSLQVLSDPILLERMLRNLITNAIKYTDEGKVVIGCRRQGKNVVIHVTDTGCGIDNEDLKRIFEIYQRSGRNSSDSSGSGIGLSIVKLISELLNHPVEIKSIPGSGSDFTICVPRLEHVSLKHEKETEPKEDLPVVALVFQDDDLKDTLSHCLQKWRCPVLTFTSVEDVCQSNAPLSILLCEYATLKNSSLSSDEASALAQEILAACTCDSDTNLPDNWITLSPTAPPAQLRALLNAAIRCRQG